MAYKIMESRHFNFALDQKLIDFVKNHPALYDSKHEQYRNIEFRNTLWTQAGRKLNRKGDDCKTRWRTIRDSYRKAKIKQANAIPCASKYTHIKLNFLDKSFDEMMELERFSKIPLKNNHIEQEKFKNISFSSIKHDDNFEYEECELKYENEDSKDQEDADAKCSDPFFYISNTMQDSNMVNPVQDFFKAMASTVMTFPPELIVETKLKICQVVSEMELRALQSAPLGSLSMTSQAEDK